MKIRFIIFCLIISAVACKKQHPISFYFWETTYKLDSIENKYLQELNVEKLYVRFFDLDIKNGTAMPVATINIKSQNKHQEVVPVVFITNETFKQIEQNKIKELAFHTIHEIEFIHQKISHRALNEIQFDCDWTSATKEKYFYFLEEIKKQKPTLFLSATIRLHQIKYKEETGVPPIDKGVLMYYATSNPITTKEENSILDNLEAQKYIQHLADYSLTLDVALPIYSWAIVSNYLDEKRLINGIKKTQLSDTSLYKKLNENNYLVKQEHYLNSIFVYEDYHIKIEEIQKKDLFIAINNIKQKMKNKSYSILFFQLDKSNLQNFSIYDFNKISK